MFTININGYDVNIEEDVNLLDFLRDQLHLTSVKNGCSEGVCGACTILLDGRAVRACLYTTAKASGRKVLTVEGLAEREKEIYVRAFADAGAVQCGFCTPGMVMSAKALLDNNPRPTQAEVKKALRLNICRCTGYVKIEQAVLSAAKMLRCEDTEDEKNSILSKIAIPRVGSRYPRVDARVKVLGTAQYVDDIYEEGMLYGAVLRSRYPRARVLAIDISQAKASPGVVDVLTAVDVPGERIEGYIEKDWPVLVAVGEETRCVGDALVLVAAITKKTAIDALKLIKVEYEELEPVTTPSDALAEGASRLHPAGNLLSRTYLKRGSPEEALASSKYVVTRTYRTPPTEQAFLEPESSLAVPDGDGGITVYSASQTVFHTRQSLAAILNLPCEKVRVKSAFVGGGFGGKEDLSAQHYAALLALSTGKPVKVTLSRQESLLAHPKRHAMEMEFTTGCDKEGRLTVLIAKITADKGAYASLGSAVLERACTHAPGPYRIPNIEIEGLGVYTNNPPAGAFRGFGVTQSVFGCESNLDLLAEKVGISPWEIRFLNALEPGDVMATGQIADAGTAIKESLMAVRDVYYSEPYTGLACALKNSGLGIGLSDIGRVKLKVDGGRIIILTSAQCIGQGVATFLVQIVAEITGVPGHLLEVAMPDTDLTPDSGSASASRHTLFTGEAARQAALKLTERLGEVLSANRSVNDLPASEIEAVLVKIEGEEFCGEFQPETDSLESEKEHPQYHVTYSYAAHVVVLDEDGKVKKVVAAHDIGKAINPLNLEGQIEGGVAMSLGFALREDFPLKKGVPLAKFGTLGLFRSTDMPDIETIIIEKNPSLLAFGAKGIGEISSIPTATAAALAYYRFDKKERLSLPLFETPYRK